MSQKTVAIDNARPGMVVAQDVLDPKGNVLVRRGVELNDSWIRGIRVRGVKQVVVEEAAPAAAPRTAPAQAADEPIVGSGVDRAVAEKFRRIDTMFSNCNDHPVMAVLAEAAKEHARSKLVEEPKP